MSTQNSQVQGNLTFAAAQAMLTRPNKFRTLNVLNQFAFNYMTVIEHINQKLAVESIPCDTEGGIITSMMLRPSDLSEQITAVAKVGSNLVITLANPNGEEFRYNFTATNDSGSKLGIVTSRTSSTVTLSPLAGQTLAVTDFTVGGYLNEGAQLVENLNSNQVEGRTIMPNLEEDLLKAYRANRSFARRDFSKSNFVQEVYLKAAQGDWSGVEAALVKLQLNDCGYDLMKQMEFDSVFSEKGVQSINNKSANTPMGFLQAVRERGGIRNDVTSPITFTKHKNIVKDIFANYNGAAQEVICLAGASYYARVEDGGQTYKYTAGTESVLEGSGLAFTTVPTTFGRVTYVPLALFNDKNKFKGLGSTGNRKLSESALYISVTTMKDYNGNAVAPIQKHYGSYGGNGQGIKFTNSNGIIDGNGKFCMNSATQIDGVTLGLFCEESHVIPNAQPLGYYMMS
jgi:hypothetical protein